MGGRHYFFVSFLVFLCAFAEVRGQSVLARKVTLRAERVRLGALLQQLEQQGGFRFSYNSNILPADSIVSIQTNNLSIEETLDRLLNRQYEYRTTHQFIIIRYAPLQLSLVVRESSGNAESYFISGQVVDKETGRALPNASVYEKRLLQSTLTDADGFFSLRLKNSPGTIALTISKENYRDVTTHFLSEVTVNANAGRSDRESDYEYRDDAEVSGIENTVFGRWLITSRQRIQDINIGGFIARAPFQASLTPGLSSHGALSGQVVNKFSLNATGGYTAGVDGLEIGLAFNINKGSARWMQLAGGFNIVGGNMNGFQTGGIYNQVSGDVDGVQISLGANRVKGSLSGFQVGGLYNLVNNDVRAMQVGLGFNDVRGTFKGVQVGLFNHVPTQMNGLQIGAAGNLAKDGRGGQIAGFINYSRNFDGFRLALLANLAGRSADGFHIALINYARHLRGFQLGLINVADTSSGYSFGLLNIVPKGLHQVEFSSNESIPLNATLKTGNRKFYTAIIVGRNAGNQPKLTAAGFGFGKQIQTGRHFLINPELSARYIYQGDREAVNILNRFDLKLHYRPLNWLAINAGPAFNVYYSDQRTQVPGYAFLKERGRHIDTGIKDTRGWIGWSAGIVLF
ncbi:carboxypeptidase regulatory-like domain-containing protein [Pedobacter sp. SYP-B3415]|uniref:carboxypeptidase-like regulatory domain-containing protein n=1 Tax=Pedobacter sp. SYP-B3415 TaxID=2496641 RepID=UPI00101D0566|nr:carboxypeptidase regulatory-like domain-containing protein [Pedobacter sp. SYP-B3415]